MQYASLVFQCATLPQRSPKHESLGIRRRRGREAARRMVLNEVLSMKA